MSPKPPPSLESLARTLATNGPYKTLETPRLVRLLFAGNFIISTTSALYVWEHPYYPQLYFPLSSLTDPPARDLGFKVTQGAAIPAQESGGETIAHRWNLTLGDRTTDGCIAFSDTLTSPAEILRGMVKVDFPAVDAWFEESARILQHPRDPFKRIDTIPSTRRVRISLKGVTVADTSATVHLYETGLQRRIYLPLTDVRMDCLKGSETRTVCPYKGEAEYWDVEVNGKVGKGEVKDGVWVYWRPLVECAKIEGLVCFYDEKFDVEIDGEKVE